MLWARIGIRLTTPISHELSNMPSITAREKSRGGPSAFKKSPANLAGAFS
jgi:hypothetical protein